MKNGLLARLAIASITGLIANVHELQADPIPGLFNTGVNAEGHVLPIGAGDPHYNLVGPVTGAIVRTLSVWASPPAGSAWIGPGPGQNSPVGLYSYSLSFDLTGFDPETAVLTGTMASDNTGHIVLNGVHTGISGYSAINRLKDFVITNGFIQGHNILEFRVNNSGTSPNPTGLLVANLSGTAMPAPPLAPNGPPLVIGFGSAYPVLAEYGRIYQLQGRETPFTNLWYDIGRPIVGSGQVEYGYEPGVPIFIPSRRWEEWGDTDGYSLWFDGLDDFAFHPHDARLNLAGSMTLEAWVRPDAERTAVLVSKALSPGIICYSLELSSQNRAVLRIFDNAVIPFVSITSSTALAVGEWRHVSVAWNGSTATMMIDGNPEVSQAAVGETRLNTSAAFQLGSIFGAQAFHGALDQVRVWNIGREPAVVAEDYYELLSGSEAGLVGLWQFSADEGQVAQDSTSNALHLQLGADLAADSNDPIWLAESFPAPRFATDILSFGEPCLVVSHEAEEGEQYWIEATTRTNPYDWKGYGPMVEGVPPRLDYLVWPTNAVQIFRGWTTVPAPDLTNGLRAYYPFSGNANDYSGNANHGVVYNAELTHDRFDNPNSAFFFNGTNAYIEVIDSPSLRPSNSLSISAWVRIDSVNARYIRIVSKEMNIPDDYSSYQLVTGDRLVSSALYKKPLFTLRTSDRYTFPTPNQTVDYGIWHHMCGTWDGSTAKLYYNGALEAEIAVGGAMVYEARPLLIGNDIHYNNFFHGAIDDIRIYDRALSSNEVWSLFNLP